MYLSPCIFCKREKEKRKEWNGLVLARVLCFCLLLLLWNWIAEQVFASSYYSWFCAVKLILCWQIYVMHTILFVLKAFLMHFEFLSRLNGVVFCVWICLEQVRILTMTQKHKLYWSVYLTLYSFENKEYISRVFKGCLANFTIKIQFKRVDKKWIWSKNEQNFIRMYTLTTRPYNNNFVEIYTLLTRNKSSHRHKFIIHNSHKRKKEEEGLVSFKIKFFDNRKRHDLLIKFQLVCFLLLDCALRM